ncbi:2og-fe alamin adenosyltransferase, partial [Globisporangium splendens]
MYVPVIDIHAFLDENATQEARDAVAEQVGHACREIGFLVVTNHGVAEVTIKDAFQAAKEYFDQSTEEKKKVPMSPEYPYGYECGEILSKSREEGVASLADLKETFQICIGALGKTPVLTPLWPEGPESFKPAMTEYYRSLEKLASTMMQIFACALKLPPTWFDNKIDNHMSSLRILNYPHQDHQSGTEQIRASAHTDYGSLTILAVDDAPGGLQVQDHDGNWQDVKAPAGSFVINLGDLMNCWTNEQWKSTMHRVVNPPPANVSGRANNRRQSIAFFHCINADTVVECIESCQSVENPAKYTPVVAGEYLMTKHNAAQGHKK